MRHFRFRTLTIQMCCWIVDLTYLTLWLICALNYIVSATEVMELYCVSIEVDFCFGLQQERLCRTDLSGLKLSVSIANPCSILLCTEVKEVH